MCWINTCMMRTKGKLIPLYHGCDGESNIKYDIKRDFYNALITDKFKMQIYFESTYYSSSPFKTLCVI